MNTTTIASLCAASLLVCACNSGRSEDDEHEHAPAAAAKTSADKGEWREDFGLAQRSLSSTGKSEFFVLEPGFELVLANDDEQLTITVLEETRAIGSVTTRVIEEREEKKGKLVEVSRNFFAIDPATGDAFYFGEEVDMYKNGAITSHGGAWLAGENGARAGMIMPGKPAIGSRYYQELAPGKAMDRAEIVGLTEMLKTPAGTFHGCLKTREGTALNEKEHETKTYAPGIGLIQDEDLLLVRSGYANAK